MTRYAGFEALKQLTKLTKTEHGYAKFIQTGDLSLCDYGRGFIDLEIYTYLDHAGSPSVRLWFGTIDDGDFGAWLRCNTKEEADNLVEQIALSVFEGMVKFPSDEELNTLLRPYGVYATYE
jgi:hypothetical protein